MIADTEQRCVSLGEPGPRRSPRRGRRANGYKRLVGPPSARMVDPTNRAPGRLGVCLGFGAALLIALVAPSSAAGAACPTLDTSSTGNCGPPFALPSWGDAGGWTDPSKYATIQLADVNGDGREELIGRNDGGLEIHWFDTTVGQWRPQVDGNGVPQVLEDFASPVPPQESTPCSWHNPWYYTTIQAGDVDGQPGEEILARFCDGMRVFKYSPPAGGNIDGGTWNLMNTRGPFSDSDDYGNPTLYPTIHFAQLRGGDDGVLFARQHSQPGSPSLAIYTFDPACQGVTSCWIKRPDAIAGFSDQECGQPSCYLDLLTANVSSLPGQLTDVVGRNKWGLSAFSGDAEDPWSMIGGSAGVAGSFSDVPSSSDCPFSNSGASGPGSGDCLGSSPSYYETLRGANIDGLPGDELVARASDGLRVRQLNQGSSDFDQLPTLPALALAGAGSEVQPGQWGSIRTGDIDGNGSDEVLALDGLALQAWSYNRPNHAWTQLEPSTPLALAADPWLTHPEYYSTIQTGDVDGDNRDDVIARGPFGIRTWFYDRRGTGGWESYLDGYPAFATAGQQAAFTALTALAVTNGVIPDTATSVRDVWTNFYAPPPSALTSLQQGLASIANCSGPGPGNPPSYQACTPPAGSSGFTAADWTSVVNQMLSESYAAGQVVASFAELQRTRESLFIAARGDFFPDLQQDLGLPAGAGPTAQFSGMRLWDLIFGIAGALASTGSSAEAGAPLFVASSLLSALPSSSPTAVSSFSTTYGGLPNKFGQIAKEIDQGLAIQSQQVRQDAGLLGLVADLYSGRTWALDTNGIESAATQGFATWVYEMLMPALYDRYQITKCYNVDGDDQCSGVPAGTGVIGGGQNFTTIGPPAVTDKTPCVSGTYVGDFSCSYVAPPSDLMSLIWGPLSDDCTYQPGGAQSSFWTYGCSVGVDVKTSIGKNSWGFTSYSGDYWVDPGYGSSAAAAGRARPRRVIALGRPRHGHQRAKRGHAYLRGDTMISRRIRLAGARVTLERLLFERGGRGELTRVRGRRAPRALRLRRTGPGRFRAAAGARSRVRIGLRRVGRRTRVALTLRIGAPSLRTPRVCHALPAATALDTPPFELVSRLRISDGRTRRVVRLTHRLRCVRDARGNISRLVGFRPRRRPARGGLAVTLRGPRRVRPGMTARYVARVHNRRPAGRGLRSSLWDVTLEAFRARGIRISRVRSGRSRTLTFTRKVPRQARQRFCVYAVATAPGTRAARAVACAMVRSTRSPGVTG
jgi:hypothetical protein